MPAVTRADRDRGYERCVVTYIDILGFRHLLATRDASEIVDALASLREFTAGDANDRPPPRRMAEVRLNSESYSEAVSDAVVRVRPVEIQAPDGAFVNELIDLVHATVACVKRDILIRGGLAIGAAHVGLDGKGPIFGPAMVRAYEIEDTEAVYPRIMIDEDAIATVARDSTARAFAMRGRVCIPRWWAGIGMLWRSADSIGYRQAHLKQRPIARLEY